MLKPPVVPTKKPDLVGCHARELLIQVRYLLDDERSFAAKLVDDRKTKLSLLAVVVGLSLFKIESIGVIYAGFESWPLLKMIFSSALGLGLLSLVCGVCLLAMERDPTPISKWFTFFARGVFDVVLRVLCRISGNTVVQNTESDLDPRERFKAALVVLYGEPEETDSFPEDLRWLTLRIEETRTAYIRLAEANRRVRKRLERGTSALLVSFTCVIVVIASVAYTAAQSPTPLADTLGEQSPESALAQED